MISLLSTKYILYVIGFVLWGYGLTTDQWKWASTGLMIIATGAIVF